MNLGPEGIVGNLRNISDIVDFLPFLAVICPPPPNTFPSKTIMAAVICVAPLLCLCFATGSQGHVQKSISNINLFCKDILKRLSINQERYKKCIIIRGRGADLTFSKKWGVVSMLCYITFTKLLSNIGNLCEM